MNGKREFPVRFDGLYRALIALVIHYDRLRWSRIRLLVAVQGAIIGGAYAIGNHYLSGMVLATGAILSLGILALVTKDERDRDANAEIINGLGLLILPRSMSDKTIRLRAETTPGHPLTRGKFLGRLVIWTLIGIDLVLVALHLLKIAPVMERSF